MAEMELASEDQERLRRQLVDASHVGPSWATYQHVATLSAPAPIRLRTYVVRWRDLIPQPHPMGTCVPNYDVQLNFAQFVRMLHPNFPPTGTVIHNFELISTVGIARMRLFIGGGVGGDILSCVERTNESHPVVDTFWECPFSTGTIQCLPLLVFNYPVLSFRLDGEIHYDPDAIVCTFDLCFQPQLNPEFLIRAHRAEFITVDPATRIATPDSSYFPVHPLERVEVFPLKQASGNTMGTVVGVQIIIGGITFPMESHLCGKYVLEFPQPIKMYDMTTTHFHLDCSEVPPPLALEVQWTYGKVVRQMNGLMGVMYSSHI